MKKILIADDEARIRRLVCDFLKNAGFETVEAADGNEAIEKFLECGDIDLVICDIMMPGADGWEVCKRIRESAEVPINYLPNFIKNSRAGRNCRSNIQKIYFFSQNYCFSNTI